jgi:2-dehydropantoate 2-reductase
MSQIEFTILGPGAIGSIIGAHLVRAGHSVVMLARGRRAGQLQNDGLRIKGLSEFAVPVRTLSDPSQLQSTDVLIIATKAPGTTAALASLGHVKVGAAFSIQNGVQKNQLLIDAFGKDRVLGSLANTSGELLESGEVLFTRNVALLVGELTGGDSERAKGIAATIDASGVRSNAVPDILSREWSKFASWVGFMALAVSTRAPTWKYMTNPDAALLLTRLVREVGVLAQASGVELTDQSMLPVATMCHSSEQAAVDAVIRAGEEFKRSAPEQRMSALQDLEAGRPLEIEGTIAYAAAEAVRLKLQLPLLEAAYRLVRAIDGTR